MVNYLKFVSKATAIDKQINTVLSIFDREFIYMHGMLNLEKHTIATLHIRAAHHPLEQATGSGRS